MDRRHRKSGRHGIAGGRSVSVEQAILLAIAIPFLGVPGIIAARSHPNVREAMTLLTASALLMAVVVVVRAVAQGDRPAVTLFEVMPSLPIAFTIEPLGALYASIASFLWIVTSIYSIGYMRGHHEIHQTRFYAYFAIAIGSAIGIAFAGNMFTLFIFYEALTLSTFPLVTHHGTPKAKRAGRMYLGILIGTSIGFQLTAIVWTYVAAGTLDFRAGGILAGKLDPAWALPLLALYVFGTGKAAVMPFHRWLPAAMVAPTPVSALLHAVAVVKAGVFTVLKVVIYVFGIDWLTSTGAGLTMAIPAAMTMILASLVAMTKDNLKARLAYSTVSQLSYVVLGAMLANETAVVGSGMHIAMHAFGKISLFFCAGAILVAAHKTEVSELDGLGRTMPLTFAAFLLASLSIIGLPPMGGTWSKLLLAEGVLAAGQPIFLAVIIVSALLNVIYLISIPARAFFRPLPKSETTLSERASSIKEAPLPCLIAISITVSGAVALFFYGDRIALLLAPLGRGG
ncbi:MAG: monovalent cation/H+ antiporter subunit D family protein [Rhodospirillaceae bacterium]|nr:monovalent cation/H+ antiporter subunit D family protein [Rhodospirillaceae bacterium]